MSPKLNCKEGTPYTHLVLIAAEYAGYQLETSYGSKGAIELVDGKSVVSQPAAIARFVSDKSAQLIGGGSAAQEALVLEWVFKSLNDVHNAMCGWVLPATGASKAPKETLDRAKNDVKDTMKQINSFLQTRTFLVGERLTLADIALASVLLPLFVNVMDANFRKPFGNVVRWFNTCIHQAQFVKVIGSDVKFCEKEPVGGGGAAAKAGGDKKEKKEKPAKAAPAAEEPMDDEPPKPKEKDPLSLLPKGTWDMDDFKRFYSNNDEDKSVPYFWEKFDKENYSIWYGEYKYPDELTMVFMSCNLIGGMFQRLEKLRKHAFASCCLFGENNNSTISGIWVWRGQELAFTQSDDWGIDYPSYDWKKLDADSEETKRLVDQYFKWTGTDKDGRKFNQGKIFK